MFGQHIIQPDSCSMMMDTYLCADAHKLQTTLIPLNIFAARWEWATADGFQIGTSLQNWKIWLPMIATLVVTKR